MSKKQDNRENTLLEALGARGKVTTTQAAELLGVSLSSARRLFAELERSGRAVHTYGGIQLVPVREPDYRFEELESRHQQEKMQIARVAAGLIQDGDTVYFDSGTTLLRLSEAVRQRLQAGELRRVRVVTNSYANLQTLGDCCDVILIGGTWREHRRDFAGLAAERFAQCFNYGKAFLGADGFDLNEGFMATDDDTARVNEAVMRRSGECYVLMDSSKFGVRSFVSYAPAAGAKAIVTDEGAGGQLREACAAQGVKVIVAGAEQAE